MAYRREKKMLEAGARAPDFQLEALTGAVQGLQSMAEGRRLLLAFFKVSCPVCQFTFPFLERIHRGTSARVWAVSQDDAKATREFNEEFGITIPALLDPGKKDYPASNAYGIEYVPSVFLIEKNGIISWSLHGFNKRELQTLGRWLEVDPFVPGEYVPEWKAG